MEKYIEVTGDRVIAAATKCGDDIPVYYAVYGDRMFRIDINPFDKEGNFHKLSIKLTNKWEWSTSIPDNWFKLLKEVSPDAK